MEATIISTGETNESRIIQFQIKKNGLLLSTESVSFNPKELFGEENMDLTKVVEKIDEMIRDSMKDYKIKLESSLATDSIIGRKVTL